MWFIKFMHSFCLLNGGVSKQAGHSCKANEISKKLLAKKEGGGGRRSLKPKY